MEDEQMKFNGSMRSQNFEVLNGGLVQGTKQKAVFTISIRGFLNISGIHYIESNGDRYIMFPSEKTKNGYNNLCWFTSDKHKKELTDLVIKAYNSMAYSTVQMVEVDEEGTPWGE